MQHQVDEWEPGKEPVTMTDELSERLLNRNYMVDWQDRLFQDSVLVRFEDGKLNPKATFTALAAFLDLPYTESMTYCSRNGERDPESLKGNDQLTRRPSTGPMRSTWAGRSGCIWSI